MPPLARYEANGRLAESMQGAECDPAAINAQPSTERPTSKTMMIAPATAQVPVTRCQSAPEPGRMFWVCSSKYMDQTARRIGMT